MIYDASGKVMVMDNFHEGWIDVITEMVTLAPDKIRSEIKERVSRAITREDGKYVVSGYVDQSKAVEMKSYFWGPYYLYVWFDGNGQPFYVGQGRDPSRIAQYKYKTRSQEFQDKIREGGCHAVMVAKHIASEEIDNLEQNLMAYLLWRGHSLVNQRDLPSREKLVLWTTFRLSKNCSDAQKRLGHDVADLYWEWKKTMDRLAPVIAVLDNVIGASWEGESPVI